MTALPTPEKKPSIVTRRMDEYTGRTFDVRVSWAEDRPFRGVFLAALPIGREILLAFTVAGVRRLVNATRVLELAEVQATEAGDRP